MGILQDKKDRMSNNIEQILITCNDSGFESELEKLQGKMTAGAVFGYADTERETVKEIITEVVNKKITKLIEYTGRFDNVKLVPDQIKISEKDLEEAHKQIDKDLL